MESFKDTKNRIWVIDVTVGAVKRVRALCGVDLQSVLENDAALLVRLTTDMVLLADVLFALVKPDADAKGVTDEEFARSFSGDVLLEASDALQRAIVSFLPRPEVRSAVRTLLDKGKRLGDLLARELDQMLGTIDPTAIAEQTLARARSRLGTLNGSSGNTPESPGSIPIPSPSEN